MVSNIVFDLDNLTVTTLWLIKAIYYLQLKPNFLIGCHGNKSAANQETVASNSKNKKYIWKISS